MSKYEYRKYRRCLVDLIDDIYATIPITILRKIFPSINMNKYPPHLNGQLGIHLHDSVHYRMELVLFVEEDAKLIFDKIVTLNGINVVFEKCQSQNIKFYTQEELDSSSANTFNN